MFLNYYIKFSYTIRLLFLFITPCALLLLWRLKNFMKEWEDNKFFIQEFIYNTIIFLYLSFFYAPWGFLTKRAAAFLYFVLAHAHFFYRERFRHFFKYFLWVFVHYIIYGFFEVFYKWRDRKNWTIANQSTVNNFSESRGIDHDCNHLDNYLVDFLWSWKDNCLWRLLSDFCVTKINKAANGVERNFFASVLVLINLVEDYLLEQFIHKRYLKPRLIKFKEGSYFYVQIVNKNHLLKAFSKPISNVWPLLRLLFKPRGTSFIEYQSWLSFFKYWFELQVGWADMAWIKLYNYYVVKYDKYYKIDKVPTLRYKKVYPLRPKDLLNLYYHIRYHRIRLMWHWLLNLLSKIMCLIYFNIKKNSLWSYTNTFNNYLKIYKCFAVLFPPRHALIDWVLVNEDDIFIRRVVFCWHVVYEIGFVNYYFTNLSSTINEVCTIWFKQKNFYLKNYVFDLLKYVLVYIMTCWYQFFCVLSQKYKFVNKRFFSHKGMYKGLNFYEVNISRFFEVLNLALSRKIFGGWLILVLLFNLVLVTGFVALIYITVLYQIFWFNDFDFCGLNAYHYYPYKTKRRFYKFLLNHPGGMQMYAYFIENWINFMGFMFFIEYLLTEHSYFQLLLKSFKMYLFCAFCILSEQCWYMLVFFGFFLWHVAAHMLQLCIYHYLTIVEYNFIFYVWLNAKFLFGSFIIVDVIISILDSSQNFLVFMFFCVKGALGFLLTWFFFFWSFVGFLTASIAEFIYIRYEFYKTCEIGLWELWNYGGFKDLAPSYEFSRCRANKWQRTNLRGKNWDYYKSSMYKYESQLSMSMSRKKTFSKSQLCYRRPKLRYKFIRKVRRLFAQNKHTIKV